VTYRADEFRTYFRDVVGAAPNTQNTYNSFLKRIDVAIGGLDEAIGERGVEAVSSWAKQSSEPPFDTYGSHARSVLKRYLNFLIGLDGPSDPIVVEDIVESAVELSGSYFQLEREMHTAVRSQLEQIEAGLREVESGSEVTTATGRLDILARDASGILVAIELKAGVCPAGALEQVLGYAQSISDERAERVRAILIASDFSDRTRAAAKRATDVTLFKYRFELRFGAVL
jgi:hypothetical protein